MRELSKYSTVVGTFVRETDDTYCMYANSDQASGPIEADQSRSSARGESIVEVVETGSRS